MLNIFKKEREFVVEEKNVMNVLKVINNHLGYLEGQVGNCGWAEEPTKWFVVFYATNKRYGNILEELNKMGTFKLTVRPGGKTDIYFEENEVKEEESE